MKILSAANCRCSGFTLLELSIVVLVLALLAAAGMRYANSMNDSNFLAVTNSNLDVVEAALQNYRNSYGRLPCPANLTSAENVSSSNTFGTEVGTPGDGNCTGYNYVNSGIDPDVADALYDSAAVSQVVEGAIPTKTLKLADRYAYDAWGNKIFYVVDKRITATNAFTTYTVTSSGNGTVGTVVVKKTALDTLANALTYKGLYALVSTGKNAHGGFVRNLTATAVRANAGSVNGDELYNCHCNNSATATTFNRIFVQKAKTNDPLVFNDNFDDIVRFKTRLEMANASEMK